MKVTLKPAAGATVTVILRDGKKVTTAEIESIELVPFFKLSNGPADVVDGETLSDRDSRVLDRFTLVASGQNGKLTRQNRPEKSVVPMVDREVAAAKPKAKGKEVAKT